MTIPFHKIYAMIMLQDYVLAQYNLNVFCSFAFHIIQRLDILMYCGTMESQRLDEDHKYSSIAIQSFISKALLFWSILPLFLLSNFSLFSLQPLASPYLSKPASDVLFHVPLRNIVLTLRVPHSTSQHSDLTAGRKNPGSVIIPSYFISPLCLYPPTPTPARFHPHSRTCWQVTQNTLLYQSQYWRIQVTTLFL